MQDDFKTKVELGAQIVIAIAVLAIAGVVIKRSLSPGEITPKTLPRIAVGERLNVPNVDWEQNQKSLVFFLMKDCAYCKSSAPFYRQLTEDAAKRGVKVLAILPNAVQEGSEYLRSLDLRIVDVRTGLLSSYKIPGTPTVLFVDNLGLVKSVWFGGDPRGQKEMRDELLALFDGGIVPAN